MELEKLLSRKRLLERAVVVAAIKFTDAVRDSARNDISDDHNELIKACNSLARFEKPKIPASGNVSTVGNGKVSASVKDIINSPKVRQQIRWAEELRAASNSE